MAPLSSVLNDVSVRTSWAIARRPTSVTAARMLRARTELARVVADRLSLRIDRRIVPEDAARSWRDARV